ncbi:MAG TPA: HEAT repeat domain-containing protein [Gemmatimonadaceae bacterium]|nr:HEAT repeat domain-containing protein [Gemmatimonadaceae bacterium]
MKAAVVWAALALGAVGEVGAQELARRVAAAPEGQVVFWLAAGPEVCGDGERMIGRRDATFTWSDDVGGTRDWRRRCLPGPLRVLLRMRGGAVTDLRAAAGPPVAVAGATDLGRVGAAEGVRFLLDLAAHAPRRVAEDAILPAALADSATVWPSLLTIARAAGRPRGVREQAAFWLGELAADRVAADSAEEVPTPEEDERAQAVFALSQLDHGAGVPALLTVARTHRSPYLRRKAMFWLGQSGDPRALALFEEVLRR